MPMAFSARGRSNARPSAASRFTLLRPTCMPVTTRLRPSAGPTRQRSCKCCCWAPCPSTAPRSTSTPPRHAQCATTGLRPKRAPKPRPPASAYEANKAADEAKTERRGQPPTPRRLWPAPMRRALPQLSWAWKQRSACPVWSWPTRALPAARRWPTCKHAGSSRCWPLDGPSGIGPMTSVRRHCRKHRGGSLNPSTSP